MKEMTVKEVALVLGVSEDSILRAIKDLFPEIIKNGVKTLLNERQVTAIKLKIDKHHNLRTTAELPKTDLEKKLLIKQGYDLLLSEIETLEHELTQANQTINLLTHDSKTYVTGEIAKELGVKSAQELNKRLNRDGIIYKLNGTWVLYAAYSDKGYGSLKQEIKDGIIIYSLHWTIKGREFLLNKYKSLFLIGV